MPAANRPMPVGYASTADRSRPTASPYFRKRFVAEGPVVFEGTWFFLCWKKVSDGVAGDVSGAEERDDEAEWHEAARGWWDGEV